MTKSRKAHLLLHLVVGGVLLLPIAWFALHHSRAFHGTTLPWIVALAALLIALMGFVAPGGRLEALSLRFCISILTFALLLSSLEIFCRLIKYDFIGEERAWKRIPLFYRWPIVPSGEVFFRRNGPEQWTGRPLNEMLAQMAVSPNPYRAEAAMTLRYDRFGFRHEEGFTDWDIAVAGDSFTELGNLPYNQLFTTILGELMKIRVLNLGTSYTGPLTQLSYLRDYGLSPATKRAAIIFYEGNDLVDLNAEYNHLMRYQQTAERPHREFRKETSLLRATYQLVTKRPKLNVTELLIGTRPKSWLTGYFKSRDGEIPITLRDTPPSRDQITPETMKQLEYFFEQFGAFGKKHGIEVWLAFMPCKERVVYGMVEFVKDAPEEQKQWRPTDLPQVISDLAVAHGVRFMDFTPALVRETQEHRELLFNSIYDGHLNSKGSHLVAEEMARFLSPPN